MRTLVIGDVHGCIDEVGDLLRACGHTPDDRVVFVGDLVAKGPDSRAVVSLARELGALAVRGNHDERLLRWWRAGATAEGLAAMRPAHRRVAESLDAVDFQWLDSLPAWLRLPEENALVVHGGFVPGVPLEAQEIDFLLNLRSITPEGKPSKRIEDGRAWASLWSGPEHVYFGHDAVRGLQIHPFATGLDTGCVYGGRLTAMVLPERRLVSVPARKVWSPPGKGPGPRVS